MELFGSVTKTSPDILIGREYCGSFVPKRTATNISEFLKLPEHPRRMSNQHQKNVGSILTSNEFREKLQKQEKQKLEKANEKRKRLNKQERESSETK